MIHPLYVMMSDKIQTQILNLMRYFLLGNVPLMLKRKHDYVPVMISVVF